jgi:hypothetical protein
MPWMHAGGPCYEWSSAENAFQQSASDNAGANQQWPVNQSSHADGSLSAESLRPMQESLVASLLGQPVSATEAQEHARISVLVNGPTSRPTSDSSASTPSSQMTPSSGMILPPPPMSTRAQREAERRRRHWSKSVTEYLRSTCRYQPVRLQALLEYFHLTRQQFMEIARDNIRFTCFMMDGAEMVRGNRSVNSPHYVATAASGSAGQ